MDNLNAALIMSVITTICYDKQQNNFLNCSNKGTYHVLYNKHAQFQFYKIDTCSSFCEILTNERHYHIDAIISNVQVQVLLYFKWQITIRFSFRRATNSSLNGTRFCKSSCYHHGKPHQAEL